MTNDPIYRALQELRSQRLQIDRVIQMLEKLDAGKPRRGRPPKVLSDLTTAIKIRNGCAKRHRKSASRN